MKADQLEQARNPLLPSALIAMRRAAQRARRDAMMSHTAIVIVQEGKLLRIEVNQVNETSAGYGVSESSSDHEDDS